jgi:hypothetical protein
MIALRGTIVAISDDTFHMRLHEGAEIWVKPTPADLCAGLEIGANVEVCGKWSHQVYGDEIRLFSAREIQKVASE